MHEPAEVPQESEDDGALAAGQATTFAEMQPASAVGTADSSAALLGCDAFTADWHAGPCCCLAGCLVSCSASCSHPMSVPR